MSLPGRKKWPRTGAAVIANQHGSIWIYRLSQKRWELRIFDPSGDLWATTINTTFKAAREQAEDFRDTARQRCPHGGWVGDCPACDVEGDLAYDAAREDQHR